MVYAGCLTEGLTNITRKRAHTNEQSVFLSQQVHLITSIDLRNRLQGYLLESVSALRNVLRLRGYLLTY